MRVTIWGARGVLALTGRNATQYGGNTTCVEVRGADDTVLVLDAGTGIRRLNATLPPTLRRIDLLLTHFHLDHILGLLFFAPLFRADMEVHIWGPVSNRESLRARLIRYLSPPLSPVRLLSLPCRLVLHEVLAEAFEIGPFQVLPGLICHSDIMLGYRISGEGGVLAYLPDHEPALGLPRFPLQPQWTSGYQLVAGADLLIHDTEYTDEEYKQRMGWGHSTYSQAISLAVMGQVKELVLFHHDPGRSDEDLTRFWEEAQRQAPTELKVTLGREGHSFLLGPTR